MAEEKAKGSIIFELLIVILSAALVGSIVYPKKLSDQERLNRELCRYRMSELFNAELQYQKYNGAYTDSLPKLVEFVRISPDLEQYINDIAVQGLDSVVTRLKEFKSMQEIILNNIPQATDTTMIDSLGRMQQEIKQESRQLAGYVEFLHDRIKNIPNMPVDQLRKSFVVMDSKQFTLDMDIVKNLMEQGDLVGAKEAAVKVVRKIGSMIQNFENVVAQIPEYKGPSLDSLRVCPTVREPYQLVHVDTTAIKYIHIYCPIDSLDIARVESDFLKSTIGGLDLENHGRIEKGEKSWEQQGGQ